ncbi:dsDNA nuclease domain-containing protein [Zwartia sp.]|uniref:dsDNA nuclease domain-containing protein n=1 Tax=Zwartia sp. TaxID=2978004 RepID=UPI00271E1BD8|nr:dsDNA nuclease domain-containing protein [Zwartia sp.]MDO9025828.1 dsDNA nuclease domain-containing protein [Zwartia sp.]
MTSAKNRSSLESLLAYDSEDDSSGQVAAQGFGYQEWYAVLRVTELLAEKSDFAVGLEVKEDIAVLDSASTPTKVEFCQVKTNEQAVAWTLNDLHRKGRKLKGGTHPPSILGKLYQRRLRFIGYPTTLRFVSNSSFKIPSGTTNVNAHNLHLVNLDEKTKQELCKALASQLAVGDIDVDLAEVHLQRSNLPLAEQQFFISGKLSNLASNGHLPFKVPQPVVAAVMLASEIKVKASNTGFCSSIDELKSARVISRSDVLKTLAVLSNPPEFLEDKFFKAVDRLNFECYNYLCVEDIKKQLSSLLTAVADRTNILFRNQVRDLSVCVEKLKSSSISVTKTLGTFMDAVAEKARNEHSQNFATVDDSFLLALSLMVIHNGINIDVLTAKASPESEVTK